MVSLAPPWSQTPRQGAARQLQFLRGMSKHTSIHRHNMLQRAIRSNAVSLSRSLCWYELFLLDRTHFTLRKKCKRQVFSLDRFLHSMCRPEKVWSAMTQLRVNVFEMRGKLQPRDSAFLERMPSPPLRKIVHPFLPHSSAFFCRHPRRCAEASTCA